VLTRVVDETAEVCKGIGRDLLGATPSPASASGSQ
jgi:hypothetical protein